MFKKLLLITLIGFMAVMFPGTGYARKAIKTVEFPCDQDGGNSRTNGIKYTSPDLYVYIPESGFQLRTAWLEVNWEGDNVITNSAVISINGADTFTFGALNTSSSGENLDYLLMYNATTALSGLAGNGTNNGPYRTTVGSWGGNRYNESVKLYLTYEFDDTSAVQLQTVRFFVGANTGVFTTADTVSFRHTCYMPEQGISIRSLWYEMRGHYQSKTPGLNDMYADIKLNGNNLQQPKLAEGAERSTSEFLYLYTPVVNPDTSGAQNTLTFHPTTTSNDYNSNLLTADLLITYTFDFNSTETIANTVRRFLGEAVAPQNNTTRCTCVLYFPENPVPKINGIYAVIRGANKAAAQLTVGDGINTRIYEMNGTFCAENRTIIHDLKGAYGNAVDGTIVTLSATWSSISAGGWSGEVVCNYEYPKSAIVWQRTVYHGGISGSTIQDNAAGSNTKTYTTDIFMPGDSWKILSVFIDSKATVSSNDAPQYNINVDGNATDYIIVGSDNENIHCERVKSAAAEVLDPGAHSINVKIQEQTGAAQDFLASAISCVTYKMTSKAAIAVKFTYSQPFTVRAGDISPPIIGLAVNENEDTDPLFDETVTLTTLSNSGSFSVTATPWSETTIITFVAGTAVFYYKDNAVNTPTITIYRAGYAPGVQAETVVIAGFRFSSPAFAMTAGESRPATVIAHDGLGNTASNWGGTATLYSSSNSGSFSVTGSSWADTTVITFNSGVSTFYYRDLRPSYPVITAARVDSWVFAATQTEFVRPISFQFASPPFLITAAGTAAITVVAVDGLGNTATEWDETAVVSTSSNSGSFSIMDSPWSDTTIIQFVSGVVVFYYQDTEPGSPVITATRADLFLSATQQGIVTGNPTQIIIITPAFRVSAGNTGPAITVIAADVNGNTDITFNSTVTFSTSSNSGYFSLLSSPWSNTTVITLSGGTAAFFYKDNSTGYPTLTVSRLGLQPDTLALYVTPSSLDIVSVPFSITAAESAAITVIARDGLGNTASWTDTAVLSCSSGSGEFSVLSSPWSDTTTITLTNGAATFFFRDSSTGTPVITVSRTDLAISDTQSETVTFSGTPNIIITKYQRNIRTSTGQSDSTTLPINALSYDTIEYTAWIKNTGTIAAYSVFIYDTQVFDTSLNHPLIFVGMDTSPNADSWSYTTDPALSVWQAWGIIPASGATDIKGLRWKIDTIAADQVKELRFRARMTSSSDSDVRNYSAITSYTSSLGTDTYPPVASNTVYATYTAPLISIKKYIKNVRTGIESDTGVNMLTGDTVEIRIDWTQSGKGGPADTLTLTDYITSGTTYVSGSETVTYGSGSVVKTGNAVIFTVNDSGCGDTGTFRFRATVN